MKSFNLVNQVEARFEKNSYRWQLINANPLGKPAKNADLMGVQIISICVPSCNMDMQIMPDCMGNLILMGTRLPVLCIPQWGTGSAVEKIPDDE